MKIRHKKTGVALEGEFILRPSDFVETVGGSSSFYSREIWESVPEWVDVTGECGLANLPESCVIVHDFREVDVRSGYRIRKVVPGLDKIGLHAFIVEKQIP